MRTNQNWPLLMGPPVSDMTREPLTASRVCRDAAVSRPWGRNSNGVEAWVSAGRNVKTSPLWQGRGAMRVRSRAIGVR